MLNRRQLREVTATRRSRKFLLTLSGRLRRLLRCGRRLNNLSAQVSIDHVPDLLLERHRAIDSFHHRHNTAGAESIFSFSASLSRCGDLGCTVLLRQAGVESGTVQLGKSAFLACDAIERSKAFGQAAVFAADFLSVRVDVIDKGPIDCGGVLRSRRQLASTAA